MFKNTCFLKETDFLEMLTKKLQKRVDSIGYFDHFRTPEVHLAWGGLDEADFIDFFAVHEN